MRNEPDGCKEKEKNLCRLKLKSLFLLLLFLLLSSSVCSQDGKLPASEEGSSGSLEQYSQDDPATMTDAEIIAELMESLKRREARIIERESLIAERESLLKEREALLTERDNLLTMRSEILAETESYWKNYKSDALKDKIVLFILGLGAGYFFSTR